MDFFQIEWVDGWFDFLSLDSNVMNMLSRVHRIYTIWGEKIVFNPQNDWILCSHLFCRIETEREKDFSNWIVERQQKTVCLSTHNEKTNYDVETSRSRTTTATGDAIETYLLFSSFDLTSTNSPIIIFDKFNFSLIAMRKFQQLFFP